MDDAKKALRFKSVLNASSDSKAPSTSQNENAPAVFTQSPAFSAATFSSKHDGVAQQSGHSIVGGVRKVARAVAHPRQTAKSHAASKIIANERPWLRDQAEADQTYLDAHDPLDSAYHKLGRGSLDPTAENQEPPYEELEDGIEQQEKSVDRVEEERKEVQVGWHMSRYVERARVIRKNSVAFPHRRSYEEYDEQGRYLRAMFVEEQWRTWRLELLTDIQLLFWSLQGCSMHYIDPTNEVPYDRAVLVTQIERLLAVSEAFQLWWMRVRKVYVWEDPWLTTKWFLLFLVLLKTGYFMSFYWGHLLYSAVTNRTGQHSRHWMRDSHRRAQTANERASMISELILRHGREDRLEPLLDEFGPWVQLQMGDTADFLEMAAKYYDWRNFTSTTSTCIAYGALFLVSAIPKLEYSIKVFWLVCGLYIFVSRPISTNFPRFRHTMDPIRWTYWDSPTAAELSFQYLRERAWSSMARSGLPLPENADDAASDSEDEVFEDALDTPISSDKGVSEEKEPSDSPTILSFSARWKGRSGVLELSSNTLRFIRRSKMPQRKELCWERPYSRLLEVRKTKHDTSTGSRRPPHALSIFWRDDIIGQTSAGEHSEEIDERYADQVHGMQFNACNDAFNAIIGVSGAWWMELRPDAKEQDRMHWKSCDS